MEEKKYIVYAWKGHYGIKCDSSSFAVPWAEAVAQICRMVKWNKESDNV